MKRKLKSVIFDILCNSITGTIIPKIFFKGIPDIRWKGFRFVIDPKNVSTQIASSIFFGFYESAEIRIIHKYFAGNNDVVELGGSLGIVSSHVASLINKGHKLVVVEANPYLINTATKNISRHAVCDFKLVNAAIAYDASEVSLSITRNNTATHITERSNKSCIVHATTLSRILEEQNIDQYTLICDIEGSEVEVLLNDLKSLKKCKEIFIELHNTSYRQQGYEVNDLSRLIEKEGFIRIYNEGPVYLFRR